MSSIRSGIRVCHVADVHLGYRKYNRLTRNGLNQREVDVSAAFRETVERIISLKPSLTVIAGDLFHTVRPSNAVVTFCFRELKKLSQQTKSPIVICAGNHETPRRTDSGCILRLFTEIPGVYVADSKEERFSFPDLNLSVLAVPHAALLRTPREQFRADDSAKYNVLVTHAQIGDEWVSEFGGANISLPSLSPHEWDYVAVGHVHVKRQLALNAWYSGAIEHTSNNIWSESRENKGFLEIELPSGKATFHDLTSPREVIVLDPISGFERSPEEITALIRERVDTVAGGIEGKLIRLEVQGCSREKFRQLDHKMIRVIRASALHFALEIRPPYETSRTGGLSRPGRLEDDLKKFCSDWKSVNNVSPDDLFHLLKRLIDNVEGRNEASLP